MTRRDFTERDIHMALDGELPADELADYQAWLDGNPEMKARSTRFEPIATGCGRHFNHRLRTAPGAPAKARHGRTGGAIGRPGALADRCRGGRHIRGRRLWRLFRREPA